MLTSMILRLLWTSPPARNSPTTADSNPIPLPRLGSNATSGSPLWYEFLFISPHTGSNPLTYFPVLLKCLLLESQGCSWYLQLCLYSRMLAHSKYSHVERTNKYIIPQIMDGICFFKITSLDQCFSTMVPVPLRHCNQLLCVLW